MNQLARILLLAGALVLALLVGILIGRGQHGLAPEGNSEAVQINTTAPPMVETTPLPPSAPPPAPAAPPKIAPDLQVQEDAAAVGMTTKSGGDQAPAPPAPAPDASSGNSAPPPAN